MELSKDGRNLPDQPYREQRALMLTSVICIGWGLPASLIVWAWSMWLGRYGSGAYLSQQRLDAFAVLNGRIAVVGVIAFLYWLHGAYRNLRPLGSTKPEISKRLPATPRDAVVSFLIPFVNLLRARRVMAHLWRESQPQPALLTDGTVLPVKTRLVNWWYATWLLGMCSLVFVIGPFTLSWPDLSLPLSWTADVLFGVMVWTIEKRQAEQFRDLQLRQPAPPVTDQLR